MASRSPFAILQQRLSRRRPVNVLCHEIGNEKTFCHMTLEDKLIIDTLRHRAFVVTEKPLIVRVDQPLKQGVHEIYEVSAEGGCTTTRIQGRQDTAEVTLTNSDEHPLKVTYDGQPLDLFGALRVETSRVLQYIITSAEDVYNIQDTNSLMKLLQVKADWWTLLIIGVFCLVLGIFAGRSF